MPFEDFLQAFDDRETRAFLISLGVVVSPGLPAPAALLRRFCQAFVVLQIVGLTTSFVRRVLSKPNKDQSYGSALPPTR